MYPKYKKHDLFFDNSGFVYLITRSPKTTDTYTVEIFHIREPYIINRIRWKVKNFEKTTKKLHHIFL